MNDQSSPPDLEILQEPDGRRRSPIDDSPTARQLVDAAAEMLTAADYDILAGIQLTKVAALAGTSTAQARRYFKTSELHGEMVEALLGSGDPNITNWDPAFISHIEVALQDNEANFEEALIATIRDLIHLNSLDRRLRAQMVVLSYPGVTPRAASLLRDLYAGWIRDVRNIVNLFGSFYGDFIRRRPGAPTPEEFGKTAILICEVFGLHAGLDEGRSDQDVASEHRTAGIAVSRLFASLWEFDDGTPFSFERFEQLRSQLS